MTFNFLSRVVGAIRTRPVLVGRFQAYNHTLPDRYPWLFSVAALLLGQKRDTRLLSFGCSRGDEVFALRRYFPRAVIKGIDVDPKNIAACKRRARREGLENASFATAANTRAEPPAAYDAIFCLAVLCLGDLAVAGAERCDPALYFADFDDVVADFSRCLKPGGYLWLHTTNFRFGDAAVAAQFEVVLEAEPQQMAADRHYGRDNRLLAGERSRAVGFRKRRCP